jgi:TP901 family phage tail tape measure protein
MLGTIAGQVRLDIRQAVAAYATLRAQNQKTVYAMRGVSESFIGAGRTMMYAGGLMAAGFGLAVKEAAEFERKMDFFGAVTGTNAQKMQELSKFTLQLAQDTIFSADEVAEGMIELGKAGVTAEGIMRGIGEAMTNLGAAADIPLIQSGQIITTTIQQYDLAARDAVHVTDLLAGAANASIADIDDIGVSLKYVGGVANAAGLSFEDTTTAISLLAKAGIRGSTAGTSLRQMIVSLGGATKPAREALKEIGILTEDGTNKFYDQQGQLKSLSSVFQILQDHLDGFNQKEKLAYLRTIFNNRALSAAALLTRDGAKGFRDMYKDMSKVRAADVAHDRLDNLSGDIEILKGNIQTLLVTAGSPFQKQMRKWVQSITKLVQAFGKLDPKTQENIVGFIGMAGATLLAMGAFSIVIGTIARFVANMLKMGAAVKLLFKIFKILIFNLRWVAVLFGGELAAALGISVGALLAIVAVIAAVVIGLIILYKKSETFRNIVNEVAAAVWTAIKALANFFKLLATDPGAAWDKIKAGAQAALEFLIDMFGKVKDWVKQGLDAAIAAVVRWVQDVAHWFTTLPGKVMAAISAFMGWLAQTFTLSNVIAALSMALGFMVGLFIKIPLQIVNIMWMLVNGIISVLGTIGPKIAGILGYLIGFMIGFFIRMSLRVSAIVARMIIALVKFFAKLPGRIGAFFIQLQQKAISAVGRMASALPGLASRAVSGISRFFQQLPGRVANFVQKFVSKAKSFLAKLPGIAHDAARNFINGLMNSLAGLPGLVAGLLQRVIDAFLGVIQAGYNAAKEFGKKLWDGFKDGIGMHSPSHIERAMWQITGTVEKETKRLAKQTMYVQKLSKTMAKTTFTTGGWENPRSPAAARFVDAASMHSANRNRSSRFLTADQAASRRRDHSPSHGTDRRGNEMRIKGKLRLQDGDAYIEGIVEDMLAESDHEDAARSRRRAGRG